MNTMNNFPHKQHLLEKLEERGPLTGKELVHETGWQEFPLWVACNLYEEIVTRITGKRYLRLDRQVVEYARLSPSIMREFCSYTVVGRDNQFQEVVQKAEQLGKEIKDISKKKFKLAQNLIDRIIDGPQGASEIKNHACFMIAGDVVYQMAHVEPRPEASTGELVRGSDLDLIVITDGLPEPIKESLDAAIYQEKYKLLINPACKEELDYLIKDIPRVQKQLQSSDFKSLVAAKILNEAEFLYGSREVFNQIKKMLSLNNIPRMMSDLEIKAKKNREEAINYLLNAQTPLSDEEYMKLFYTAEEKEEIF